MSYVANVLNPESRLCISGGCIDYGKIVSLVSSLLTHPEDIVPWIRLVVSEGRRSS